MLILLALFSGKSAAFFIDNDFYSKALVGFFTKVEAFIIADSSFESKVYLSNLIIFFTIFCLGVAIVKSMEVSSSRPAGLDDCLQVGMLNLAGFVVKRVIILLVSFVLFFHYPLSVFNLPFYFLDFTLSVTQIALWYLWANTVGVTLFVIILYFNRRGLP
ncbi:MAG: hypothetical protein ACJAWL_001124 [Motiliproteus sp.]|jgi:hypothetical protein